MAAVGTVVKSVQRSTDGMQVTLAWTADTSGDVAEGGTTGQGTFSAIGYFVGIQYEPGTATDLYDVTLLDSGGKDILRGDGADQASSANLTYDNKYRSYLNVDGVNFWFFSDPLTFTVANAGSGGTGTVKIKFSRSI